MSFDMTTVIIPFDESMYDDKGMHIRDDERGEPMAQVVRNVGESDEGCIRVGYVEWDSRLSQHLFVQSPELADDRLTHRELLAIADLLKKMNEGIDPGLVPGSERERLKRLYGPEIPRSFRLD